MKLFVKAFAVSLAITTLFLVAAIAAELNGQTPKNAPLAAPSPIEGTRPPNDVLTTPAERSRLEQERQDRIRNPNATGRQTDFEEEGLGIKPLKEGLGLHP